MQPDGFLVVHLALTYRTPTSSSNIKLQHQIVQSRCRLPADMSHSQRRRSEHFGRHEWSTMRSVRVERP